VKELPGTAPPAPAVQGQDGIQAVPIPVSVLALQQPDEKRLVKAMIEEIRSKLAVDLDPNPTFERGLGGQERPKQARDFLVIGSSNASKLSKALSQQGYSSCCIFNQNFRIDTASAEDIRPGQLSLLFKNT
jgi:hypothetical protein